MLSSLPLHVTTPSLPTFPIFQTSPLQSNPEAHRWTWFHTGTTSPPLFSLTRPWKWGCPDANRKTGTNLHSTKESKPTVQTILRRCTWGQKSNTAHKLGEHDLAITVLIKHREYPFKEESILHSNQLSKFPKEKNYNNHAVLVVNHSVIDPARTDTLESIVECVDFIFRDYNSNGKTARTFRCVFQFL